MDSNKKSRLRPLFGAIVAVSNANTLEAAAYDVVLTGFAIDYLGTIVDLVGVPETPRPALYQAPRLGNYAGPGQGNGWPTRLAASIDVDTGLVTDFELQYTQGIVFGTGGPTLALGRPGFTYTPAPDFGSICTVTNDANDADGVLQIDCPATGPNLFEYAVADVAGMLCATPQPSTLTPGSNGCSSAWGGFPNGFSMPQVANGAAKVFSAPDDQYAGVGISLTSGSLNPANPDFYISLDWDQNEASAEWLAFQRSLSSGQFIFHHSGTLNGGDFVVTDLDYNHQRFISFVTTAPGIPKVTSHWDYDFDTVVSQDLVLQVEDAKNVPALGGFGIASLFTALMVLGVRLGFKGES